MIVDAMLADATEQAKQRKPPRMAAWSVGRCTRQNWFMEHDFIPEAMPGRAILRFELGDLVENTVCQRIERTAIDFLRTDQRKTDNLTVPSLGFRCRSDFLFSCPDDLSLHAKATLEVGELVVVAYRDTPPAKGEVCGGEIKSMSNYAFEKAQSGILDEAYLAQIECNIRALDVRWWCCIAYRAETANLCEIWVCRDDNRWQQIQADVAAIRSPHRVDRPYQLDAACTGAKTGACVNGKTPGKGLPHKHCGGTGKEPGGPYIPNFPCGYCSYKAECWLDKGKLALCFVDGKPRWRLTAQPGEQETA